MNKHQAHISFFTWNIVKAMERIDEVGRRIAIDEGAAPTFHIVYLCIQQLVHRVRFSGANKWITLGLIWSLEYSLCIFMLMLLHIFA